MLHTYENSKKRRYYDDSLVWIMTIRYRNMKLPNLPSANHCNHCVHEVTGRFTKKTLQRFY